MQVFGFMKKENKELQLYLMCGMATSPDFMEDFRYELSRRMIKAGLSATSQLLFPYGDWSRKAAAQMLEITHDTALGPKQFARSVGGRRAAQEVSRGHAAFRGIRVFIGHSGGGVAAAHASRLLLQNHAEKDRHFIIQIGSPKCAVHPEDQRDTLYIRFGGDGRRTDPVTRMGSWGGWEKAAGRWWRWNPEKYAPASRVQLSLIGGHADYFRRHDPFVSGEGVSNLEIMTDCIQRWLKERMNAAAML